MLPLHSTYYSDEEFGDDDDDDFRYGQVECALIEEEEACMKAADA